MKKNAPVLLIGLDAAEVTLVENLCSEHTLTELQERLYQPKPVQRTP